MKLIIGILLFILPGYCISRILNISKKNIIASTFVLSSLIIFYSILILSYSSYPANFANIAILLILLSLLLGIKLFSTKHYKSDLTNKAQAKINLQTYMLLVILIFSSMLALRTFFQPMISPDSVFRWNHLASLIFESGNLKFYPPCTIHDYIVYPYPDGFPPFVSSIYAYLYLSLGKIFPPATSIIIFLQYIISAFYLAKSAKLLNLNQNSAIIAFLASPLLFFSFFLGQETGWTALSSAGFFYYLLQFKFDHEFSSLTMCAVFASLGALCREYGLVFIALIIPTFILLNLNLKQALVCTAISIAISSPFFIKNSIVFGNPFYPLSFFGFLPHNITYEGILSEYSRHFFIFSNSEYITQSAKIAIWGFPLQILGFIFTLKRKSLLFLHFYVIICIAVWILSTKYTCGGIFYSMRVLSPSIIPASLLFSSSLQDFSDKLKSKGSLIRIFYLPLCIIFVLYFFFSCLINPHSILNIKPKHWLLFAFSPVKRIGDMIIKYTSTIPPGSLILSDSALYQAYLYRNSDRNVNLIPVWTPEMRFLFDESISFEEKTKKLNQTGIFFIMRNKDTVNNNYLEKYSFFREYPEKFKEIIRGPDSQIFFISN